MFAALMAPGEAWMQKIRMPAKFTLVAVVLLVPIVALMAVYLQQSAHAMRTLAGERAGVAYLRAAIPAINPFQNHRGQQALKLLSLGDAATMDADARRFETQIAALSDLTTTDGDRFGVQPKLQQLAGLWQTAKTSAYANNAEITPKYDAVIAAFNSVIEAINDGSKLSLAPDLETAYITELATLNAPNLLNRLAPHRSRATLMAARPEQHAASLPRLAAFTSVIEIYLSSARALLNKIEQTAPDRARRLDASQLDVVRHYLSVVQQHVVDKNDHPPLEVYAAGSAAAAAIDTLVMQSLELLDTMLVERESQQGRLRAGLLGTTVVFVLFALYIFIAFYRASMKNFSKMGRRVARLGAGDLTVPKPALGHDEVALAINGLRTSVGHLSSIVRNVRTNAEEIAVATEQISHGNADLAARGARVAATVEETTASMEALNGTVSANLESARQANALANTAYEIASRGGRVVAQAVATMQDISDASRRISDITQVIDGIAFQTNILALNAAVEAARAGEQGRGFAVVAAEVRSLAQRSAAAAKEINGLISTSIETVAHGAQYVNQAGQTMDEIVASVHQVNDIMATITSASSNQTDEIGQIAVAIRDIDAATQQNAALVEEISAAAASLQSRADHLATSVRSFTV